MTSVPLTFRDQAFFIWTWLRGAAGTVWEGDQAAGHTVHLWDTETAPVIYSALLGHPAENCPQALCVPHILV